MANYAAVDTLATELGREVTALIDAVRLLRTASICDAPLTQTQKAHLETRVADAITAIAVGLADLVEEVSA